MTDETNEKPMYEGNWSCAECGAAITKLPFQPDPNKQNSLRCLDCYRKQKQSSGNGAGDTGPKQMYEGSWTCAKCGAAISKLPFQPDPERLDRIQCIDCFKQGKQA